MKSKVTKLLAVAALLFAVSANADQIGWNGDGGNNGGGWNGGHDGGHGDHGGGWDNDDIYVVDRQITCESNGYNPATCGTGLERTHNVYLARQLSKSACIQGSTYSIYGDRINVSGGCRAVFIARGMTRYPQASDQIISHQQPHPMVTVQFGCASNDYKTSTCAIPLRRVREVYLSQQLSKSACTEGYSYRIFDRYVEVSQGCRAVFTARGIQ